MKTSFFQKEDSMNSALFQDYRNHPLYIGRYISCSVTTRFVPPMYAHMYGVPLETGSMYTNVPIYIYVYVLQMEVIAYIFIVYVHSFY